MSTPKEIKAVADNIVVVFSKTWCPYSKKAKALLKDKYSDAQTAIFELDEREDGAELQNYLQEKTGQRTVPNIFISAYCARSLLSDVLTSFVEQEHME
ncbi:hypothetical protein BGY98DRAFT_945695, partial [Russula aff. rugulosa BPL654]